MFKNPIQHMNSFPAAATLMLLLIGLMGLISLPADLQAQTAGIGRDEAVAIVTDSQLAGSLEGIRLYIMPDPVPEGRMVSTWKTEIISAETQGWFIFVDLHPAANWEHPCLYIMVDAITGEVRREEATVPPRLRSEMIEITNGRDNPEPGVSEAILDGFSERLRELPKPKATRGQSYAFIISGGADQSNNHIRYWNDSAFIYRTLVEYYGYADDHIRVCIADGTNPAADRSNGTNSPPDLDGDGDDDIEYPATLEYVGQVFNELAATLTATDQLFIFTTDHGGQESGQDCLLNLWNWEDLRDDQMAAYITALPCQTIICTFEQCYSGGMIDDLEGDGRVIATACHWSELSWAMGPDYIYDTFVYHWTSAVAGQTPYGDPVDADTNDDGIVSMQEAFIYAEANDFEDEEPQYSSTPAELGNMLNLFGSMDGVYLALDGVTIDDDNFGSSQGDGDGVIEYGETIELTVALNNMGLTDADDVVGTLTSVSPYVTITTEAGDYNGIPSEATVANSQPYVFLVDNAIPDGEPLDLILQLNEAPDELPLALEGSAPLYAVTVIEINDNGGDGIADPGEDVALKLRIENLGSSDSPQLNAVLQSGGFFQADETPHNMNAIPSGSSADVAWFSVHIDEGCPEIYSGQLTLALTGAGSYAAQVDLTLMVGPWFDTAETDLAWTIGLAEDTATTGLWERSDPVGTTYESQPVQPEDDHTLDPGHICFVTGNGTVGGTAGENDLDGGKTTLLSPVFNLQGATSATISYWRWYTNDLGNNPGQDYWDVDVSTNGTDWVHLEHTVTSDNSWTEQTFDLSTYILFSDNVRFRFVAADEDANSLVEAAVDDIMVTIIRADLTGVAEPEEVPQHRLALNHCVPNPMNPSTMITFELPADGPVSLRIFDVNGRLVKTLLQESHLLAGPHTAQWNGLNTRGQSAASGVYFVRLQAPGGEITRSVVMVR
ncbi:MAG: T9SS type A sorting domain-containing protein [bacterium]|nr:T9SS type A sorting domain-containing protein [bacterium]